MKSLHLWAYWPWLIQISPFVDQQIVKQLYELFGHSFISNSLHDCMCVTKNCTTTMVLLSIPAISLNIAACNKNCGQNINKWRENSGNHSAHPKLDTHQDSPFTTGENKTCTLLFRLCILPIYLLLPGSSRSAFVNF